MNAPVAFYPNAFFLAGDTPKRHFINVRMFFVSCKCTYKAIGDPIGTPCGAFGPILRDAGRTVCFVSALTKQLEVLLDPLGERLGLFSGSLGAQCAL